MLKMKCINIRLSPCIRASDVFNIVRFKCLYIDRILSPGQNICFLCSNTAVCFASETFTTRNWIGKFLLFSQHDFTVSPPLSLSKYLSKLYEEICLYPLTNRVWYSLIFWIVHCQYLFASFKSSSIKIFMSINQLCQFNCDCLNMYPCTILLVFFFIIFLSILEDFPSSSIMHCIDKSVVHRR